MKAVTKWHQYRASNIDNSVSCNRANRAISVLYGHSYLLAASGIIKSTRRPEIVARRREKLLQKRRKHIDGEANEGKY